MPLGFCLMQNSCWCSPYPYQEQLSGSHTDQVHELGRMFQFVTSEASSHCLEAMLYSRAAGLLLLLGSCHVIHHLVLDGRCGRAEDGGAVRQHSPLSSSGTQPCLPVTRSVTLFPSTPGPFPVSLPATVPIMVKFTIPVPVPHLPLTKVPLLLPLPFPLCCCECCAAAAARPASVSGALRRRWQATWQLRLWTLLGCQNI